MTKKRLLIKQAAVNVAQKNKLVLEHSTYDKDHIFDHDDWVKVNRTKSGYVAVETRYATFGFTSVANMYLKAT